METDSVTNVSLGLREELLSLVRPFATSTFKVRSAQEVHFFLNSALYISAAFAMK
jgi:hypothetical protein